MLMAWTEDGPGQTREQPGDPICYPTNEVPQNYKDTLERQNPEPMRVNAGSALGPRMGWWRDTLYV